MARLELLLMMAAIGCTPDRMIGTIDQREWPITESFLVLEAEAYGEDDLLTVNLSSLPDPCRTWQLWDALAQDAEGPADLADAWKETFPEIFWEIHVGARLRPATWPVGSTGWAGLEWDATASGPEQAFAVFVEHRGWRSEAWFEEALEPEEALEIEEVYTSHAGVLKWRKSTPGRSAKGRFNTDVVDAEASRLGRVTLSFSATPCPVDSPLWVEAETTTTSDTTQSDSR
jgi:hypothetical protein